jgi:hypothetical protein
MEGVVIYGTGSPIVVDVESAVADRPLPFREPLE